MIQPSKEDISKLHAEINSYLGQRWVVVATSISIVGAVLAWISQKVVPNEPSSAPTLMAGTALLSVFVTLIGFIECALAINQRIPQAFLRQTRSSNWETAVKRFRDKRYQSALRVTGKRLVLLILEFVVFSWPFILMSALEIPAVMSIYMAVHIACGALAFVSLLVVFPLYSSHQIRRIERLWAVVLNELPEDELAAG